MKKQQFIDLTKVVLDYILELDNESIEGLLSNSKVISIIDKIESKDTNSPNNYELKKIIKVSDEEKLALYSNENNGILKNDKDIIKEIKVKKEKITRTSDIDYIIKKLDKVKTREEAKRLLSDKNITNKMLRDVGDKLGLYIAIRYTKKKIIDKLIDETIGLKLKMKRSKGNR